MPAAWRHIEPQPEGDIAVEVQDIQKSKRKLTKLACNNCRTKKTKCDGGRPECEPCKGRGPCVYEKKNWQVQTQELRGENEQLKHENEQLKHENEQLKHENEQLKHDNEQLKHGNEQLARQMNSLETATKSKVPADVQRTPEIPPDQQLMGSLTDEPSYTEQPNSTALWPNLVAEQCLKDLFRAEHDLGWNSSCPCGSSDCPDI